MKKLLAATVVGLLVMLSGCGGANFTRPMPETLAVGKSTSADVTRIMGEPFATANMVARNEKFQILLYGYTNMFSSTRHSGVIAARLMKFYIFNGVVAGEEFISSFAAESTEFDVSKVSGIHAGKTTRSDVLALFGKPNGEVLYPIIKNKSDQGIIYSYQHQSSKAKMNPAVMNVLAISFDTSDVVSDVEFTSAEFK